MRKVILLLGIVCIVTVAVFLQRGVPDAAQPVAHAKSGDYERARWDPVHFKPAIDTASDETCLSCHQEILENSVRKQSPAGLKATDSLAWYQTLDTFEGEQATFHWRHLKSPYATQVMQLKCNTCHQGNDPRDQTVNPPNVQNTAHVLRKNVNPDTCLMCHGKFPPVEVMGLPAWTEIRDPLDNNCLTCHANIRTTRHQVNFLKPEAIEKLAASNGGDVCYGCHGGRQWYRISFPYPRHAWEGMGTEVPDWARSRPTQSMARFLAETISDDTSGSKQP
jgi:nitrate/TMAO reductase-like tetraheme cytochrome c subunit